MIEGITITLSVIAFAGLLYSFYQMKKCFRQISRLRKETSKLKEQVSLIDSLTAEANKAASAFTNEQHAIRELVEQHASKLNQIQLGARR